MGSQIPGLSHFLAICARASPEKPRGGSPRASEPGHKLSSQKSQISCCSTGRPNVLCSFWVHKRERMALLLPESRWAWKQQVLEWPQSPAAGRSCGGAALEPGVLGACALLQPTRNPCRPYF